MSYEQDTASENTGIWANEASVRTDMKAGLPQVKRLAWFFVLGLLMMYVFSGIYVVQPDERGVVTRFGSLISANVQPGIHYRLPWPVEKVATPQTTSIKRMSIGYKIMDRVRGLAPTSRETQFVTGDENIIEAQLLVQYVVKDPAAFLFGAEEPHWLVRKSCEAVLTEKVTVMSVDDILTTGKLEIERYVKTGAQEILDSYGTGIELVAAHIQEVNPPREVADAFRDVASAREDRNRIIQEANGYANRVVPMARGEGAALVIAARGDSTQFINAARGEGERFRALVAEYRKGQGTIRTRLWLETMETVLSSVKKYVLDDDAGESQLDLRFMETKQ